MATAFWCLVPRCGAGSLFHPVVAAWLMHISLGRWCQADPQTHCFIAQPVCGPIQISILVFFAASRTFACCNQLCGTFC